MATEPDKIEYGGDLMLFLGSTLPIAFSTDAKLSIKLATRDISSKDSGYWVERKAGRLDWSASSNALYTDVLTGTATTTTIDELFALMIARTAIDLVFAAVGVAAAPAQQPHLTKKKYSGKAIITGLEMNAPDGDNASYSITLEGAGALAIA